MKITLFDRTEIIVSKTDGEKLERLLLRSQDGYVKINGITLKKSGILKIEQGGYTEADIVKPIDPDNRLKRDNRSDAEQYKAARKAAEIAKKTLIKRGIYELRRSNNKHNR